MFYQALSIPHRVYGSLEGVFAQGQVYVLFSRVTDPRNLCLIGIPPMDLVDDVYEAVRASGHDAEEWMSRSVKVTGEWTLVPGPSPRQRLVAKFVAPHLSPVRLRSLAETLDPQPEARAVYAEVLAWIDRVDEAAARGAPRPPFLRTNGEDIFPEGQWWLTVHQRKALESAEQAQADEDGPPSEVSEEPSDHLAEDSDPMSDSSAGEDKAGLGRTPDVAWRRHPPRPPAPSNASAFAPPATDPSPPAPPMPPPPRYQGFFERQQEARCGLHALNNAIGHSFATAADLEAAVQELLRAAHQEGLPEVRAQHCLPGGWYSAEVLSQAITQVSLAKRNRVEFVLILEPLCVNAAALRTSVGSIVNIQNRHWVALRWLHGAVWLLDSQDVPRELNWQAYQHFVRLHRSAFRIERV